MKYVVTVAGREHEVTLDGSMIRADGFEGEGHVTEVEGTPVRIVTIGNRIHQVLARRGPNPGQYTIDLNGFRFEVEALDERSRAVRELAGAGARASGPAAVVAPMPGLVVRVAVQPGDQVIAGQGVVVIEAMKMENELKAAASGTVRLVSVTPGSVVEKGAVLVDFERSG